MMKTHNAHTQKHTYSNVYGQTHKQLILSINRKFYYHYEYKKRVEERASEEQKKE